MKPESMNMVFLALSHETRRKILDIVQAMPGCSVADVSKYFSEISRIAVMKHLDVLQNADLVISRKIGRKRELFFNAIPIQMIYDRWTTEYSRFWATRALDVKYLLEGSLSEETAHPDKADS